MALSRSTSQHVRDHLGQAEFSLKVAANFECLKGTPAHDAVRAALAKVGEAKAWVEKQMTTAESVTNLVNVRKSAGLPRNREVLRRMARLIP